LVVLSLQGNRKRNQRRHFGGADGIRTHDLLDAIEARSQLRHGPTGSPHFPYYHLKIDRVYTAGAGISVGASVGTVRGTNLNIVAFTRMVISEAASVAL
jgi:hypothetical protein